MKIEKEDKLKLKQLQKKFSMERIKKIRGLMFEGYGIDEAIKLSSE